MRKKLNFFGNFNIELFLIFGNIVYVKSLCENYDCVIKYIWMCKLIVSFCIYEIYINFNFNIYV